MDQAKRGHTMPACWGQVVRASGELWDWLAECRLGFTRPVAARVLGHDSGDAHDEALRERNLPPFKLLRDWVYVVLLLEREERGQPSVHQWVRRQNGDPAMYYRFVKKVTGLPWREVKKRGSLWARKEACRMWGPYLAPPSLPPSLRGNQENMTQKSHNTFVVGLATLRSQGAFISAVAYNKAE